MAKYDGDLATPIEPLDVPERDHSLLPPIDEETAAAKERNRRERLRAELMRANAERFAKIDLLMKHYRLDEVEMDFGIAGWMLALKLAEDHVPGFKYRKPPPTRKKDKWDFWGCMRLVLEVAHLREGKPKRTQLQACEILVEQGMYIGDPRVLERRLQEARKEPLVQFFMEQGVTTAPVAGMLAKTRKVEQEHRDSRE